MPRPRYRLSDMDFDEVSMVDKGANQDALITIAKRATEEEVMPDLYYEDGTLVDENALSDGDIVYDEEGKAYQFTAEAEDDAAANTKEPEPVGKSAFLDSKKETKVVTKSAKTFGDELREELSKAFSDEDRDSVLSKAFGRIDQMEKTLQEQAEIAKSERDLRLTREYISKASEYNVPVAADELGPVLYRMAETMSYEDCAVIEKCLTAAGEMIFEEVGYIGGGDNQDVMSAVEAKAVEVGKSASPEAITSVFDSNPQAYDEYLASQRGRY